MPIKFVIFKKLDDFGSLAQLARASALQAEGHRFESYNSHQKLDLST